ncbi:MAG TPA: OsmC family protein [Candidatus Kapabacteria bacterium]|nr:OsmC family protein [Candidatus Kapabacteria bacterium]
MKATLRWDTALRFVGTNEKGQETIFDTSLKGGGLDSAAGPMEIVLEAAAACTAMDIVTILKKKRRIVTEFTIDLDAERAEQHPKVFTKIAMDIRLVSPDATEQELRRAIELSQTNYCSVSIMLARSGCEITWRAELSAPREIEKTQVAIGGTA